MLWLDNHINSQATINFKHKFVQTNPVFFPLCVCVTTPCVAIANPPPYPSPNGVQCCKILISSSSILFLFPHHITPHSEKNSTVSVDLIIHLEKRKKIFNFVIRNNVVGRLETDSRLVRWLVSFPVSLFWNFLLLLIEFSRQHRLCQLIGLFRGVCCRLCVLF